MANVRVYMHITFDTNVIGPLACPDLYSTCPDMSSVDTLRKMLRTKSIHGYMSEASMSLEAISNDERVDTFLRQWASKAYPIQLPEPSPERQRVFSEAYKLDIMVLHAPRIALGSFIEVPESCWASDANYGIQERQDRYHTYIRNQTNTGSSELKQLGAELVTIHGLSTNHLSHLAALPSWQSGNLAIWQSGNRVTQSPDRRITRQSLNRQSVIRQFRTVPSSQTARSAA